MSTIRHHVLEFLAPELLLSPEAPETVMAKENTTTGVTMDFSKFKASRKKATSKYIQAGASKLFSI